jgi:hypothetical protein
VWKPGQAKILNIKQYYVQISFLPHARHYHIFYGQMFSWWISHYLHVLLSEMVLTVWRLSVLIWCDKLSVWKPGQAKILNIKQYYVQISFLPHARHYHIWTEYSYKSVLKLGLTLQKYEPGPRVCSHCLSAPYTWPATSSSTSLELTNRNVFLQWKSQLDMVICTGHCY